MRNAGWRNGTDNSASRGSEGQRGGSRKSRALWVLGLAVSFGCANGLSLSPPTPATPAPSVRAEPAVPGPPALLAFVTVAGLTTDRISADGPMPALAVWAGEGVVAARVDTVVPATTYSAHASLMTGVDSQGHGIHADRLIDEAGLTRARPWSAESHQAPTLWGLMRESGRSVVALDWPSTQGSGLAAVLPDGPATYRDSVWPASIAGETTPWLLTMAQSAPLAGRPGAERDKLLVSAACAAVAGRTPELLLIRLRGTESPLSQFGPDSPEAAAAFAAVDAELVRLRGCLQSASPKSALVVMGDRSFLPVHTAVRPNRVLREAGLLGADGESWDALVRAHGGSAFLYAKDAESALAARSALDAEAEARGSFRVVSAEEMISRRVDPEAWFGLEAASGFTLLDGERGPPVSPAPVRASAGYFETGSTSPAFVAIGQGFRRHLPVPSLHQLDVAPTLAHLLGVELGETAGRSLIGLLRVPGPVAAGPPDEGVLE